MTVSTIRRASRAVFAVALLAFMIAPAAQAQISSDRPGFSNSAATVSQGTFQTELGYSFLNTADVFGDESQTTHNVGELLLRYGVTDAVELRAGVGSLQFVETVDGTSPGETTYESGYFGPTIEAKARLLQTSTTTVSAFSQTLIPVRTGIYDDSFLDDRARQSLALLFDGSLGEGLSLTLNAGSNFFWSAGDEFSSRDATAFFIPTLSIGINDQAGAYVGYYGEYTKDVNTNFVEGGFTYLVSRDTQIDINTGYRIDENADQFFVGVGLAQRF